MCHLSLPTIHQCAVHVIQPKPADDTCLNVIMCMNVNTHCNISFPPFLASIAQSVDGASPSTAALGVASGAVASSSDDCACLPSSVHTVAASTEHMQLDAAIRAAQTKLHTERFVTQAMRTELAQLHVELAQYVCGIATFCRASSSNERWKYSQQTHVSHCAISFCLCTLIRPATLLLPVSSPGTPRSHPRYTQSRVSIIRPRRRRRRRRSMLPLSRPCRPPPRSSRRNSHRSRYATVC